MLLSDGESDTGTDPYDAAAVAARLRVKFYTVGLGTPDGSSDALDENTLMGLAQATGGEYCRAASARELGRAYRASRSWFPFPGWIGSADSQRPGRGSE